MIRIQVHLLPQLAPAPPNDRTTAVVIDVLRATSSVVTALAEGARQVIPCQEVEQTLNFAKQFARESSLLGGERAGKLIPGFDVGNAPREYVRGRVEGKTILFTTTNGTRAMAACHGAHEILIASFLNASAVAEVLKQREEVAIYCAGTEGEVTGEDVLLAGCLLRQRGFSASDELNDSARLALAAWDEACRQNGGSLSPEALTQLLRKTRGSHALLALGYDADIAAASQIDRYSIVPRYDAAMGQILG